MSELDFEIPGYDIIEAIGRGGMASVYRARQHSFDRNVALKILKPDLSEDEAFCQRFMMESLIVAKLSHSNIVQVYDVGEVQNHYYIAMEFLSGGDLHTRLKQGLAVDEAVSIVKQMASALDFAHRKNIIHRDLKPDNVMFREDGAAVLTDFGIAKETSADINLTQTGLIVGTPKYMSPEQIKGAEPSPAGDIYSLGIMFFQLLSNRVPFSGADLVATAYQHFNEPVPPLPAAVAHFQGVVEHMLAKNVNDRIASGREVIAELERIDKIQHARAADLDETSALALAHLPGAGEGETLLRASAATRLSPRAALKANPRHGQETVLRSAGSVAPDTAPAAEDHPPPPKRRRYTWLAAGAAAGIALGITTVFLPKTGETPTASAAITGLPPAPIASEQASAESATLATPVPNSTSATAPAEPAKTAPNLRDLARRELQVQGLLDGAALDEREGRYFSPNGQNAAEKYRKVLNLDPDHTLAKRKLAELETRAR